jgi:hypothetical protein
MPKPPNVEIIRNPIEEQLAQALEAIPKIEPENKDLSNLNFVFLIQSLNFYFYFPIIKLSFENYILFISVRIEHDYFYRQLFICGIILQVLSNLRATQTFLLVLLPLL